MNIRGGDIVGELFDIASYAHRDDVATHESASYGFRVVSPNSIVVPEPGTYAAIFGALALAFAAYRRRK